MTSPSREPCAAEDAPGSRNVGLHALRGNGEASLGRALPLGLSVVLHLLVFGAVSLAARHSKRVLPPPPITVEVVSVELAGRGGRGGQGGGGGGTPVRAQAQPAPPPPAPMVRAASRPQPAPSVASVPPPLPAPALTPALSAVPPPPPAAAEPQPAPFAEASPPAAPPPSAPADVSGPTAGSGAGGSGGGSGTGNGTGIGSGSGNGIGSGTGDGVGSGTGDGGDGAGGSVVRVLDGARPPYPPAALRAQWEGSVRLRVIVSADGSATSVVVRATSGHEVLDRAAVKAVSKWRFAPARKAGRPVVSLAELTVRFRLDEAD